MTLKINDSSRYVLAVAERALNLAVRAEALAAEMDTLGGDIRAAGDEAVCRTGFRSDYAAADIRRAGRGLQETAGHRGRIAAVTRPRACRVQWGACPGHGNTLTSCAVARPGVGTPGAGRSWDWDRVGLPCTEPARSKVTDRQGGESVMCDGHLLHAPRCLEGARVEPRGEFT